MNKVIIPSAFALPLLVQFAIVGHYLKMLRQRELRFSYSIIDLWIFLVVCFAMVALTVSLAENIRLSSNWAEVAFLFVLMCDFWGAVLTGMFVARCWLIVSEWRGRRRSPFYLFLGAFLGVVALYGIGTGIAIIFAVLGSLK